jgi:methyl-accepting chemotaxis protein
MILFKSVQIKKTWFLCTACVLVFVCVLWVFLQNKKDSNVVLERVQQTQQVHSLKVQVLKEGLELRNQVPPNIPMESPVRTLANLQRTIDSKNGVLKALNEKLKFEIEQNLEGSRETSKAFDSLAKELVTLTKELNSQTARVLSVAQSAHEIRGQ